jgi:hypothetical protein
MSYPKQLQLFDETVINSDIGTPSFGDKVVLGDGWSVLEPYTVNIVLRFLEEDYTGYLTTIDHVRHEPRFRPFDTAFGDVVVFPAGSISGDQSANELIEVMRVLWNIDRAVSPDSIGYATSVQN